MTLLKTSLRLASAAALVVFAALAPSSAAEFRSPEGPVILTIAGTDATQGGSHEIRLDAAMLAEMGQTSFVTTTIWTEGPQKFTGVLLKDLMDALGVKAGGLKATAINDYAITIPVSDAVASGPIVAYHLNDAPMSVRERGPLWIVYPYDSNKDYATEVIYSRSIWQLDRIDIVK